MEWLEMPRRGSAGLAAVLLLVMAGQAAWASVAAAQGSSRFSENERRLLRRGELVVRREAEQRGDLRLIGGTAFQVVDAPPDAVWRAVMDIPAWRRFVPQVTVARVVAEGRSQRTIYLRHAQGPVEADYHLNLRYSSETHMAQFRLDKTRPHDIREGWGFFIVSPFGDGQSILTFGVMVDVGSGVMTGLMRPALHQWMLRVPEQLKNFIEGSGRRRYVR
jgi:hypothetical protein